MELKRKLAAVLAADIVGYSALMAEAEEETLQHLEACRVIFRDVVGSSSGRIFNTAGDAILAELPSALAAMQCALNIQRQLAAWNTESNGPRKMLMRIGITIGDVFEQSGDLLGDGVNIASRLQALAAPGGICVSRWVHEQVVGKLDVRFTDLGEQKVKNIPKPVHVFTVDPDDGPRPVTANALVVIPKSAAAAIDWARLKRPVLASAAAIGAVGLAAVLASGWWRGPSPAPVPPGATAQPAPPKPDTQPDRVFTMVNPAGQPVLPRRDTAPAQPGPAQPGPAQPARVEEPARTSAVASPAPAATVPQPPPSSQQAAAPTTSPAVASPAHSAQQAAAPPAGGPAMASLEPAKPTAILPPPQAPLAQVRQPGDVFRDCDQCPDLIVVPAGMFTMGSPAGEQGREPDEGPQRPVRIGSAIAAGRGAVTVAQFDTFVRDSGRSGLERCRIFAGGAWGLRDDHSYRHPGFPQGPDHPAVCISWQDAKAYVAWLSAKTGGRYRLPSEAEREYLARAGSTTAFWWGDGITPQQANFDATLTYKGGQPGEYRRATRPVFDFEPNLFGLSQVHGNVAEWTEDCWNRSYAGAPSDGSAWLAGDCGKRVLRGGAWGYPPKDLRAAYREAVPADHRYYHVGVRVVRELDSQPR